MLQKSPQPKTVIYEDEVRRWFVDAGCKVPGPNAINAIATHCSLIQARVMHPRLTAAAEDVKAGKKAISDALEWLRKFERMEQKKGMPLRSDFARAADALAAILPTFALHPSYANPDKRWQTHIHLVADLVITVRRVAGRHPAHRYGTAEGKTMKLICRALQAIDGGQHDPVARLSWLKLNPDPTR